MAGLIEEIQREALDNNVAIESLLRRVRLASAKLQLGRLGEWVDYELNGYSSGTIPSYRNIDGRAEALNPARGDWMPIMGDPQILEIISRAPVHEPVASIRELVNQSKNGFFHYPVAAEMVDEVNRFLNFRTPRIVVEIPRGALVNILDRVRTLVLDWAIEMEGNGIIGEGLSFNIRERQEAQTVMANFTIGKIGNFSGNLGVGNTSRDNKVSLKQASEVSKVVHQLREAVPELERAGVDKGELVGALDAIDEEVAKGEPDKGRLAGYLTDARSAVSGAAGNLMAEGALSLIAAAMKMLG